MVEPGVPSPRGLLVSASCAPHTHAATHILESAGHDCDEVTSETDQFAR